MIVYISTHQERAVFAGYLGHWGRELRKNIRLISYDQLFRQRNFTQATYIFSDIERLSAAYRKNAAQIWNQLKSSRPGCRLLNHPLEVHRRYRLLRGLYEAGINRFDVYRIDEDRRPTRYPVFLKRENDHLKPESKLLNTEDELEAAIKVVRNRLAPDEILITEFHNNPDEKGRYWKYSAFIFERDIVPGHLFVEDNWYVKTPKLKDDEIITAEYDYITQNPHREVLARVGEISKIDYGRVDYNIVNGEVQVFEINTNPMIMGARDNHYKERSKARLESAKLIERAFKGIDTPSNCRKTKKIPRTKIHVTKLPVTKRKRWYENRGLGYSICCGLLKPIGLGYYAPAAYSRLNSVVEFAARKGLIPGHGPRAPRSEKACPDSNP